MKKVVEKRHLEIIEQWNQHIQNKVNFAREIDIDEKDDVKQFITIELFKAACNRHKYNDWETIAKTVVARRLMDYAKKYRRTNYRFKSENTFDDNDENNNFSYLNMADVKEFDYHKKFVFEQLKQFHKRITEGDLISEFSKWERECLDAIIFLYENEADINTDNIMNCMGDEPDVKEIRIVFNNYYNRFRAKMNRYIEEICGE